MLECNSEYFKSNSKKQTIFILLKDSLWDCPKLAVSVFSNSLLKRSVMKNVSMSFKLYWKCFSPSSGAYAAFAYDKNI